MRVTTIRIPNGDTRKLILDATAVIFSGVIAFDDGGYLTYNDITIVDDDTIIVNKKLIIAKSKIIDLRGYE